MGVGLLVLALVGPRRHDASGGATIRLVGFGLVALAYEAPRVWAAVARLRNKE